MDGRMHLLAASVLLYIVFDVTDGTYQSRLYRLLGVKHWPFVEDPIATHSVKNMLKCARLCMLHLDCMSFVTYCKSGQWDEEADCHLTNLTSINSAALGASDLCCGMNQQTAVSIAAPTSAPITFTTAFPTTSEMTSSQTTTPTPSTISTPKTVPPITTSSIAYSTNTPTTASPTTTSMTPSPATTTSSTLSSTGPLLLDIVWGVRDICFSGSSEDILAFTDAGIYVYDANILTLPCRGPVALSDMLPGYTTLPAPGDVKAVLMYQTSKLELYTASAVYQWQVSGGGTPIQNNNQFTIQPISSFLNLPAGAYYNFNWGCYRDYSSWEKQFSMDNGGFCAVHNGGMNVYNQSDSSPGLNGYDYNLWGNIPSNTVALTGYGSQYSYNFTLVTSDLKVYTYALAYSGMSLASKTLTLIGNMTFT